MYLNFRKAWFPEKKDISFYTVDEFLVFLFGILGTMPIISVGGNTIFPYLFLLMTGVCLIYAFIERQTLVFDKNIIWPLSISILSAVSGVLCLTGTLPSVFKDGEGIQILWELLYGLFFLALFSYHGKKLACYYVKGVYLASLIQLFWCVLQLVAIEVGSINLNALVFGQLLGMSGSYGYGEKMFAQTTMLSGLCWHPSNLAPLFVIGYVLSGSWILKVLFIMIGALCGNRTVFLGTAICFTGEIIWNIKQNGFQLKTQKWVGRILFCILLGTLSYLVIIDNSLLLRIGNSVVYYAKKTFSGTDASTMAHMMYLLSIPKGFQVSGPLQMLFGYGPGCSGYVGTELLGMYKGAKWVLECEFANILWSYGLLGFLLRYAWYLTGAYRASKTNSANWIFVIAIGAMGIFYNVMYNWMILFIYSVLLIDTLNLKTKDNVNLGKHKEPGVYAFSLKTLWTD